MDEDVMLMIPGPTIVPPRVTRAMSRPIIPHRGSAFSTLFLRQIERLKAVFRTSGDVFILSGSGTAAMEAGLANVIAPEDTVLCLVNGKFSERFMEIAEAFGARAHVISYEWGTAVEARDVEEFLDEHPETKAVTMVFNETSTGVRNPVADVGRVVAKTPALLIVDTISALAGDAFETDAWHVDICATGSQKCFALPPGLAFVSVSDKAWEVMERTRSSTYYLDLRRYRSDKAKAPYTPPVTLVYGLEAALDIIEEEGLDARIARHQELAALVRESCVAMGFSLFPASEDICSATVTSLTCPQGIDPSALRKVLSDRYNIAIAGGQAQVKDTIIRIGHMGVASYREVYATLACLREALEELMP
ncbi:MAG: alanine--glyoxylate aminotransferase family protein [Candidatus Methanofastidiosa archaeon]|nr:alanine--glyoxylate aminotransferase family protein [Candidatus Methanofastidiosa archaeon]